MSGELAKLERAAQMLAEIRTVQDAANLADYAEAARVYARKAKLGEEAEADALVIRLQAESRLGQLMAEGQAAGSILGSGQHAAIPNGNSRAASLADLGVTAKQVHEAKQLAHLSDAEIAGHVRDVEKSSRRKVLKEAKKKAEKKRRPKPPPKPTPTRTREEQADYDWRHDLRNAFFAALGGADNCWHPNNIDAMFLAVEEHPFDPVLNVTPDRIHRSADRLHELGDEWKRRFPE